MRRVPAGLAGLAMAFVLIAATPQTSGILALHQGSRLWFDGTSTVRSWTCTADRMDAEIESSEMNVAAAILEGRKVPGRIEVEFPVAMLECKNGTMNEHMRKALKASENRTNTFALSSNDIAKTTTVTGALQGTLQLGGQTRPITIPIQFAQGDHGLRVTGKVPVTMTTWGIKPPTLMLGALKVGETVTVHFDLQLTQ
jgi:polyisoprenoid-binding protein YceI